MYVINVQFIFCLLFASLFIDTSIDTKFFDAHETRMRSADTSYTATEYIDCMIRNVYYTTVN